MAYSARMAQSSIKRFGSGIKEWLGEKIEEIELLNFRVKIRGGIDAENWKFHGKNLFQDWAEQAQQVFWVIDELPIFLKRMLDRDQNANGVEEFLSWLRGETQQLGQDGPVLMISGSIGLKPLVRRLGIPDRINHLYTFQLGPWDRNTSIRCFELSRCTPSISCRRCSRGCL